MKTKEEILEHLKTTKYDCIYTISGWLIGKGLKDAKEYVCFLTNGDKMYNFDYFLAWVDMPNIEVGDYVHVVVPELGEDWHSIVTGIHKDTDDWCFKTCHPNHPNVSYPIQYATKESKEDAMKAKDKDTLGKARGFILGDTTDGMHATATLNMDCPAVRKMITSMEILETLNSILPEEESDSSFEVTYAVICNGHRYEIIADEVKEFADALCFFVGEEKVASFPPKTPWFKI